MYTKLIDVPKMYTKPLILQLQAIKAFTSLNHYRNKRHCEMGFLPGDAKGEGPGDDDVLFGERGDDGWADEGVEGGGGGT